MYSKHKPSAGTAITKYVNSSAFFDTYAKWYTDFWWVQYKDDFDKEIKRIAQQFDAPDNKAE